MTPLAQILHRRIAAEGPMTVAEYMALCLLHPRHGYYTTRDPLGAQGDFTTAPEISQMFGELIGLSLAQSWIDQGRPTPFVLAELGPGRGTLMADATRAMGAVPGMLDAATLCLVEASPALRARQSRSLQGLAPTWVDSVADLPEAPLFLIANEFFDALPVRQFIRAGEGWAERVVGLYEGALAFGLTEPAPQAALMPFLATPEGDLITTCAPAEGIVEDLGRRISSHGGAALVVDYGDWGAHGDTFQAVQSHTKVPPLAAPGQADLTAHVDFRALAAAAPCAHTALVPQGVFLETLGITRRAQRLADGLTGAARDAHVAAHRRLTHPGEMGSLFKVLGFVPEGAPVPPGLLPADRREG
ncbi:class I SAM-dependent methyltransferase [Salipiger aestuarii]|uniref:class I SAM-dependent methyltransferase n=1 Tax=Salipiger aestuarii TaxID=568098 RepID=UPI00025B655A|nr:SAM-dependent methyltransferase [Salipiger aestuarii]EIE49436.1 hypothetical protein C357_18921 [Citreicella sp. 357]KAA8609611.1 ATP synthase subunit beta [Salipiger aestuarii]